MLSVGALALLYDTPGWTTMLSGVALLWLYLFRHAKVDSVRNLWWALLAGVTFVVSFVLTSAQYANLTLMYANYEFRIAGEKAHLIQQGLAFTLLSSIVSSIFSEKELAAAAGTDSAGGGEESNASADETDKQS